MFPQHFSFSPNFHSCFYLTNRFHVAVRLFSSRSQMTSKCGKNKKVAHEAIAECVTDVLNYGRHRKARFSYVTIVTVTFLRVKISSIILTNNINAKRPLWENYVWKLGWSSGCPCFRYMEQRGRSRPFDVLHRSWRTSFPAGHDIGVQSEGKTENPT